MVPSDCSRWAVESSTVLLSRSLLGDERSLAVAGRVLPGEADHRFTDRHTSQLASMVASQAAVDTEPE
jgi:hypothetical protein